MSSIIFVYFPVKISLENNFLYLTVRFENIISVSDSSIYSSEIQPNAFVRKNTLVNMRTDQIFSTNFGSVSVVGRIVEKVFGRIKNIITDFLLYKVLI